MPRGRPGATGHRIAPPREPDFRAKKPVQSSRAHALSRLVHRPPAQKLSSPPRPDNLPGLGQSSPGGCLKVRDVAKQLGISIHSVYRLLKGQASIPLPAFKLGPKSTRVRQVDLDHWVKLHQPPCQDVSLSPIDGIARVNRKEYRKMTRRRFQTGCVRLRKNKHHSWWEGFYREDVALPDARIVRKQRTINLGLLKDVPTKRQAQRALADTLAQINAADYQPRSVITVRDFIENKYKPLKLQQQKWTTQQGYKGILRRNVLPHWGELQLSDITEEDAQALLNLHISDGLARNTLKNIKWAISSVFTSAMRFGYCKSNPIRSVDLPPEEPIAATKLPSEKQWQKLLSRLGERERMMIWLMGITTARPSELAIKWSAIDFKRRRLSIRLASNRGHLHTPKVHRQHEVELTQADVRRLTRYRAKAKFAADDDFVFVNRKGGHAEYSGVMARNIQPVARKLGFHVTWKMLRKYGSTFMHDGRVPLKARQSRLGHSRPEITMMHYTELSDPSSRLAARVLSTHWNKILDGAKPRSVRA